MKLTDFLSNITTYTGGTVELTHPVTGIRLVIGIEKTEVTKDTLFVHASWVAKLVGSLWQDGTSEYRSIYHIGKVEHFEEEVEAPNGDSRVFLYPKGIPSEVSVKERRKRSFYFYPPKNGKTIGKEMYVVNY